MNISMNAVCLYGVGLPKFSQNGGSWYQNEQYRICLELTPDLICLAIQNNIEGILIAEYGPEQGAINSADVGKPTPGCVAPTFPQKTWIVLIPP